MLPELNDMAFTQGDVSLGELPSYSGVYRFYSGDGALLYVGKSVDIRSRINAHVQEGRKPGRHQRIMSEVRRIDCTATAGEIGALLVENAAIKQETPLYNRRQRQVRKLWTLLLNCSSDGFLQPSHADFSPWADRSDDCYGLFHNRRHIDNTLRRHARDHGLCLRVMGMDPGSGPCFQYQLKRCDGACAGDETVDEHNARLLSVLDRDRIAAWPFAGPLLMVERNIHPMAGQPAEQFHLVNHWAWLGCFNSVQTAKAASREAARTVFDRDAYRLLMSAMRKGLLELIDATTEQAVDNPLLVQGSFL